MLYIPEEDGRILRWNLQDEEFLAPMQAGEASVFAVAISLDGRDLACGSEDGSVWLWRRGEEPALLERAAHRLFVCALAFSPDGRELASAGRAGRIRLWDVATRRSKPAVMGHEVWVNRIVYSPDGRLLLSASDDNTVRLWEMATHRLLQVFRCAKQVTAARFTPDSRYLYMSDGLRLTRYEVAVDDRIDDPRELLHRAEQAAGVRLEGLELLPLK